MRTKSSPQRPVWLSSSPKSLDMVFFDLETTGGNPQNSGITEIAMIKYRRGIEVGRYHTLVNPERPISHQVRKITGITNAMVESAPTIDKIIDDIIRFIGESILVSHGVIADYAYLQHYAKALRQLNLENYYLCTHLIVSHALPHIASKSLTGVAEHYGVSGDTAHRAMADAEMTARIFWKIFEDLDQMGFSTVEDFIKIQADHHSLNRLGTKLDCNDVDKVPSTPGILRLFNQRHEVIYCTATSQLKRALRNFTQISDEREQNEISVDASSFKIQRTRHFLDALLIERQQLNKLNLSVDPRKFERRGRGLVQVLIPPDLLEWSLRNPGMTPFQLPPRDDFKEIPWEESGFDSGNTILSDSRGGIPHNRFLSDQSHLAHHTQHIPIRLAHRSRPIGRLQKYKLNRTPMTESVVRCDCLGEGTGWFFIPADGPRAFQKTLEAILEKLPFHDTSLPYEERIWLLHIFISLLSNDLDNQIISLKQELKTVRSFFNPIKRKDLKKSLAFLSELKTSAVTLKPEERAASGLALVSNNETKELEIFVVVKGSIRRTFSLPREESKRLQSARLFTRIFSPFRIELKDAISPLFFSKRICDEIELFHYWMTQRGEEGEWVYFSDLEPLYDESHL